MNCYSIAELIDFRFTQRSYLVSEDAGSITICIELVTNEILPRDVEMNIFTINFTDSAEGEVLVPNQYMYLLEAL